MALLTAGALLPQSGALQISSYATVRKGPPQAASCSKLSAVRHKCKILSMHCRRLIFKGTKLLQ